jgi:hypothetical protein
MGTAVSSRPEQGQLVSVRQRQWVGNDVRASTLPPPALKPTFHGPQRLLTLASVTCPMSFQDWLCPARPLAPPGTCGLSR